MNTEAHKAGGRRNHEFEKLKQAEGFRRLGIIESFVEREIITSDCTDFNGCSIRRE